MASGSHPCFTVFTDEDDVPGSKFEREPEEYTVGWLKRRLNCRGLKLSGKRDEVLKRVSDCINSGNRHTLDPRSTMANSSQQKFSKKMQIYKQAVA